MRSHVIPSLTVAFVLASCTRVAPASRAVSAAKDQGAESASRAVPSATAAPTRAARSEIDASTVGEPPALDASTATQPDSAAQDSASTAARSCTADTDCVLVTGGCQGPMAAHRDDAARVDAQNRRLLSVATCDGRFAARPVRAACSQSRCVLDPMDRPEWRTCERTRECMPVHRHCLHWQSINRRFEREARDAMRLSQPCGPTVVPPPPRIECRYGWCVAGWAGE